MITTAATTGIFFELKVANAKPRKASLDAMDIMKFAGGISGGVLVNLFSVYKKWINEGKIIQRFMAPRGYKVTVLLAYFSMVKISLGLLTAK